MRRSIRASAAACVLLASIGLAAAQNNPPADQQQQPNGPPPAEARPVPEPRLPTQPPGQEADNAKPTMLQPEHSATPDRIAEPIPGATRQTEPSTVSAANAAQDRLPILAMQLPLTDDQKSKIAASLSATTGSRAGTPQSGPIDVTIAQSLPSTDVTLLEFPSEAKTAVPEIARYKYLRLSDRLLIVDPPFWTVVGEIKG